MRTVVAVDWSEQSFNAVKVVCRLFTHESLTLIHAVDLRPFENPLFAQPLGSNSAGALREGMVAAGERLLDQTGALVPVTIPSIQRVYKIGNPAPVVLEAIRSAHADLVAVGSRGRGRLAELVLGSVSHRVVLHAPCSALLVRDDPGSIRRVLLTVEGYEDSVRLRSWLSTGFQWPIDWPSTSGRASSSVWRILSPPGTSPTPVWPVSSVRISRLRVKNGPWAPLRLSNMPSCPAMGMTCMRMTRGV